MYIFSCDKHVNMLKTLLFNKLKIKISAKLMFSSMLMNEK